MTSPDPRAPLVLIVDDNERNRRLARDVLRAGGLRTIEAATGRESIALALELEPDVILLDLELPDMHGTEVAAELRNGPRTARIPVVALSARRYDGDRDQLRAAGFVDYLEKPIDVGAFAEQARQHCKPTDA